MGASPALQSESELDEKVQFGARKLLSFKRHSHSSSDSTTDLTSQHNFQTVENNEWRKHVSLHMQGAARSLPLKQLTEEYDVSVGAA